MSYERRAVSGSRRGTSASRKLVAQSSQLRASGGTQSAMPQRHCSVVSHVESPIMPSAPNDSSQETPASQTILPPRSITRRFVQLLHPQRVHTAFSATVLMVAAILLSRVVGFLREMYIAWAFGASPVTDAYLAGFTIPDWFNYLVAGGTASITFVSIYTRFVAGNKEHEAQKTFSIIITVMTAVLGVGVLLAEFFAPEISRHLFPKFSAEQMDLCVHLTRILLPAQIFFYVGGVVSAVLLSRRLFLFPALGPLIYNVGIIAGGVLLSRQLGIASLAVGAVAGA